MPQHVHTISFRLVHVRMARCGPLTWCATATSGRAPRPAPCSSPAWLWTPAARCAVSGFSIRSWWPMPVRGTQFCDAWNRRQGCAARVPLTWRYHMAALAHVQVVCAGSQDTFEIFVWSVKTGRLLEVTPAHDRRRFVLDPCCCNLKPPAQRAHQAHLRPCFDRHGLLLCVWCRSAGKCTAGAVWS